MFEIVFLIIFLGSVVSVIQKRSVLRIVILILYSGSLVSFYRPVCVLLSQDTLKGFNMPIEQRIHERDSYYLRIWQQRNGQWYQCKTYISRLFFF